MVVLGRIIRDMLYQYSLGQSDTDFRRIYWTFLEGTLATSYLLSAQPGNP